MPMIIWKIFQRMFTGKKIRINIYVVYVQIVKLSFTKII